MDTETLFVRTLRRASKTLGGDAELAKALDVEPDTLKRWISGIATPTVSAYLKALDIFTSGPLWSGYERNLHPNG